MKRGLFVGFGLLAAVVVALSFVPRFKDVRLTVHGVLVRFGMVVGLDHENVEFQSGGVTLSGTIVFPRRSRPRAAVA